MKLKCVDCGKEFDKEVYIACCDGCYEKRVDNIGTKNFKIFIKNA